MKDTTLPTIVLVALVVVSPALAGDKIRESSASAVRILDKSALMHQQRDYWITTRSGPVGSEGIPELIRLGDRITVKGKSLVVKHIYVHEILEDMSYRGESLGRKGDIQCTIVESPDDRPGSEHGKKNRLWIHARKCEPVTAPSSPSAVGAKYDGSGPILLITPYIWAGLPQPEQDVYTAAALETWSFVLYGMGAAKGKQPSQQLSDFVACAKAGTLQRFTVGGWLFGQGLDQSMAAHIFENAPGVCGEYAGRGNGSPQPLHLYEKADWMSFDARRREVYVIAYVEMADHLERLQASASGQSAKTANYVALERCLAATGIEGLLAQLAQDQGKFEWEYPLPWSISKSVGAACAKYRN